MEGELVTPSSLRLVRLLLGEGEEGLSRFKPSRPRLSLLCSASKTSSKRALSKPDERMLFKLNLLPRLFSILLLLLPVL